MRRNGEMMGWLRGALGSAFVLYKSDHLYGCLSFYRIAQFPDGKPQLIAGDHDVQSLLNWKMKRMTKTKRRTMKTTMNWSTTISLLTDLPLKLL